MTDEPSPSYSHRRAGRPVSDGPGAVPVTTTMPMVLRDWLRRHADEQRVPMAQILTRALLEYRAKADAMKEGV